MCKKQTSVSHRSTESEVISLDTGLRLDGIPALELWDLIVSFSRSRSLDLVIEVLQSSKKHPVQGDLVRDEAQKKHTNTKTKKHINRDDYELFHVDHGTTNAKPSHFCA